MRTGLPAAGAGSTQSAAQLDKHSAAAHVTPPAAHVTLPAGRTGVDDIRGRWLEAQGGVRL
jgi:hypothetical protein